MRTRKGVAALSFLLLVAGCTPGPDVTATESDDNHQVQWHDLVHYDGAILEELGHRYQPDRTAPGSAVRGTYTGRYKAARRPGTTHVALVEQNNANTCVVDRHFAVDVTVH